MFSKIKKNHPAFTLVEMLVVIAVLGIISAISFELLGQTRTGTQNDSACNEVAAAINKARSYALSGKFSGNSVGAITATISSNSVTISGNGSEVVPISSGSCSGGPVSWAIPSGTGGGVTITCTAKNVVVDSYKAVCQ